MEAKILFEDSSIVIVDKPAGMIVNRADTTKNVVTLQDWIDKKFQISNFKFQKEEENKVFFERSGIVHRLDKETSGVLIIAKNPNSFKNLQQQFKEGRVEKTYIALCHGKISIAEGEINVPVGRLPWNRTRFGVIPMGRESKTLYKVLEYKILKKSAFAEFRRDEEEVLTLLELHPKTGRTHQIRVHLQYLGHPIFADELYAGRKIMKSDRKLLPRHFLHAAKIKFTHPTSNEVVEIESPLPPELSDFLAGLQEYS